MSVAKGVLVGMGNPLLDISAHVPMDMLTKYDVKPNNAILAEDKHLPMYQELVDQHKAEFVAGGATQNSIRVAQWMLKEPQATRYFGCIGTDVFGQQLKKSAQADGVDVRYLEDPKEATGTCAVLVTGSERSLIANLAAANHFKIDHLNKPENWSLIEDAKFYYIASFFLTVSPESQMKVAKHAAENNKVFMMNLSAPFLLQFFKEPVMAALPYWDFIFGNEDEAVEFAKAQGWETTDVSEIATKLQKMPKANTGRSRVVCFTQGAEPTVLATEAGVKTYPVIALSKEQIVDTNGAGDAFVGGFIASLVKGRNLDSCVSAGNYAANVVIQRSGCTFPEASTHEL